MKAPEKHVKVIELTQCEKCGKKLSARTLAYSHMRVCPASEDRPSSVRCKKEDTMPIINEAPTQAVALPKRTKVRKRQNKLNSLFASAL